MKISALNVINGPALWSVEQGDVLTWLAALPERSVDLFVFSPPYEKARLYLEDGEDLRIARSTEEWVAWMVLVMQACLRACKGLVVCVCEGQTKNYRYSAGPLLLAADLHRAGVHLRKPPIYRRVGIPGSGGPDWWRNDYEFCLVASNGGKLPWSDNTATGHPPKWAPGGAMSHRLSDGQRVNQWGKCGTEAGVNGVAQRERDGSDEAVLFEGGEAVEEEMHTIWGKTSHGGTRTKDGSRDNRPRPSHKKKGTGRATRGSKDGDTQNGEGYDPPVLANPGNVVQQSYTAEEVADLLGEPSDVIDCNVGGGQMGSPLSHDNEAPFPESIVEPFVRCFAPPAGIVCDPFSGSGTTGKVALRWGRRFIGCDLRHSQVELTKRRMAEADSLFSDALEDAGHD